MEQNRFRSWALWLAVVGAVWTIIVSVLGYEPFPVETLNTVLDALGYILIAFGIMNNPTNKTGF